MSASTIGVRVIMLLTLGCASTQSGFTDRMARGTIEALWNEPDLGLMLGQVFFVTETPNAASRHDLVSELPLYHAAADAGFITLSEEKELTSGWPVRSAVVSATDKGKAAGVIKRIGQTDELWIKIASYKVDEIVANDSLQLGADRYRVVLGTHSATIASGFEKAYAQARLQADRRFKVLLKYDPFGKKWLLERMDLANRADNFATANVDNRITQLRLCGPSGC